MEKIYDEVWRIAIKMLDINSVREIPVELKQRLQIVNDLCEKDGGVLRSRQVIAMIIEQYQREGI
jgi:hypothetical protein